jgi:hypothetical protein
MLVEGVARDWVGDRICDGTGARLGGVSKALSVLWTAWACLRELLLRCMINLDDGNTFQTRLIKYYGSITTGGERVA